jgi:hypothetical protein
MSPKLYNLRQTKVINMLHDVSEKGHKLLTYSMLESFSSSAVSNVRSTSLVLVVSNLLHIREVVGSNASTETVYHD